MRGSTTAGKKLIPMPPDGFAAVIPLPWLLQPPCRGSCEGSDALISSVTYARITAGDLDRLKAQSEGLPA
jgi:hypothetical protein